MHGLGGWVPTHRVGEERGLKTTVRAGVPVQLPPAAEENQFTW